MMEVILNYYSADMLLTFIRLFLTFFSVLLVGTGAFFFLVPKSYWPIVEKRLKMQGVKGAKPTKYFYTWVKISSIVQIVLGIVFMAFVLYYVNRLETLV